MSGMTRGSKAYSEGGWAPVVIETLLHVFFRYEKLQDSVSTSASIATLQNAGMIRERTSEEQLQDGITPAHGWKVTPRGRAHVAQLLTLRYPVPSSGWETPDGEPIKVDS